MDNHTFFEGLYQCPNCGEAEVENQDEWCDDCNLPERSAIN